MPYYSVSATADNVDTVLQYHRSGREEDENRGIEYAWY